MLSVSVNVTVPVPSVTFTLPANVAASLCVMVSPASDWVLPILPVTEIVPVASVPELRVSVRSFAAALSALILPLIVMDPSLVPVVFIETLLLRTTLSSSNTFPAVPPAEVVVKLVPVRVIVPVAVLLIVILPPAPVVLPDVTMLPTVTPPLPFMETVPPAFVATPPEVVTPCKLITSPEIVRPPSS